MILLIIIAAAALWFGYRALFRNTSARAARPSPAAQSQLSQRNASAYPEQDEQEQIGRLRQNLRLKVMYNEAIIDRLIQAERERFPSGSTIDWYHAAIQRWEDDNR